MENRESTRAQLLKASNLADLVGELLDRYIGAEEAIIGEMSDDLLEDNEELLQEVDKYRARFAELVLIEPNTEQRDALAKKVKEWWELKDE